jgi:hypothetical protein
MGLLINRHGGGEEDPALLRLGVGGALRTLRHLSGFVAPSIVRHAAAPLVFLFAIHPFSLRFVALHFVDWKWEFFIQSFDPFFYQLILD